MKKLRQIINNNGIFLASLLFVTMIVLPQLLTGNRPANYQEQLLVDMSKNIVTITQLRAIVFTLILVNTTLVYRLLSAWMSKRRAGLSIFMLASIPVWLVMQVSLPVLSLVMLPLLISLLAFDKAGRSTNSVGWYALSGLAVSVSWVLEPVATSIIMVLSGLLLIAVKPRYARHIVRQSSFVIIILAAVIALVSLVSWRFGFGGQAYIIKELSAPITVVLVPQIYWIGPKSFYIGLPGIPIIPASLMALGGLGAWQLFVARKRPRNVFLLVLPLALAALSLQLSGITALVLLYITMVGAATWMVMGAQYLHNSWKHVFPRNKLAKNLGDGLIALMLASLVMYSFWYVNRAWSGSPDAKNQMQTEWNKQL